MFVENKRLKLREEELECPISQISIMIKTPMEFLGNKKFSQKMSKNQSMDQGNLRGLCYHLDFIEKFFKILKRRISNRKIRTNNLECY